TLPTSDPHREPEGLRGSGPLMLKRWQLRLVATVAAVVAWANMGVGRGNGVILDRPALVEGFILDDHNRKPVATGSLKGHVSLVLAGFTNGPDVCPFTLANLEQVVAELGLRVRPDRLPTVIFLAVDPDRDRPNLKDYVVQFHPDFIGVTGAID